MSRVVVKSSMGEREVERYYFKLVFHDCRSSAYRRIKIVEWKWESDVLDRYYRCRREGVLRVRWLLMCGIGRTRVGMMGCTVGKCVMVDAMWDGRLTGWRTTVCVVVWKLTGDEGYRCGGV